MFPLIFYMVMLVCTSCHVWKCLMIMGTLTNIWHKSHNALTDENCNHGYDNCLVLKTMLLLFCRYIYNELELGQGLLFPECGTSLHVHTSVRHVNWVAWWHKCNFTVTYSSFVKSIHHQFHIITYDFWSNTCYWTMFAKKLTFSQTIYTWSIFSCTYITCTNDKSV